MAPEAHRSRRLFAAVARGAAGLVMAGVMMASLASPAEAQFFERRQRPSEGFNPFSIFTPLFQREPRGRHMQPQPQGEPRQQQQAAPVEQTKAPPPQKSDTTPSKRIVVMGASLSDWLAYGLEDIYSDRPDIGVIRKNQLLTGLVRFDSKDDTTWPRVARDFLKDQNPDVIVMLLGLEDRISIRDRASPRDGQEPEREGDATQPAAAAPEARRRAGQPFEFRTDQWAEIYGKRIDEMIAVLKSKGAPVIWVGLPAIRGTRSTSDMIYLNDLFRARAERAGITYVDVWDGFVDEAGRFTMFGPDVEGQMRRLRTQEGVYFTKPGARKLAHYVEREIKRVMGTRIEPMALPKVDESGQPVASRPGEPARPLAGPTVSLTGAPNAEELLGGSTRPGTPDPMAARVLVKGTAVMPPSGRADNFYLSPAAAEAARAAAAAAEAPPAATALTAAAPAVAASARPPAPASIAAEEPKPDVQDDAAKKPVANLDQTSPRPAARPAKQSGQPARSADSRVQQPNRPAAPKQRPIAPRDPRTARRPFDPFGLFR